MFFVLQRLDTQLRQRNAFRKRLPKIAAALPNAIDLIALVMQAGLDFQVALMHYVERGPAGPLREELERVTKDIQLGQSRVQALHELCGRVPEPSLKETVRSLIQGIELGTSLAPVLRLQAQTLRRHRAALAEKQAALAPLKLLFPLFVFIFPTVFIVLLGPILLTAVAPGGGVP